VSAESYNPGALLASGLPLGPGTDRALNYLGRSLPSGGPVFSRASCRDLLAGRLHLLHWAIAASGDTTDARHRNDETRLR
jgi:hypothetical protein